jgi:aspartyl-tRNA(Asn)/glutamyl-tRNA(Gln) amidotransferase subunit B
LIIEERRIQRIVQTLPELPDAIRLRLMKEYGVSLYDASVLVDVAGAAEYYEEVIMQLKVMNTESKKGSNLWKQTLNWITNELLGRMRPSNITFSTLGSIHKKSNREENYSGLTPVDVGEMIAAVTNGTISGKIAKAALDIVFAEKDGASPMSIVEREGWVVVSDKNTLMIMCKDVIDDPKHSNHVKALQSGEKPKLIGFFVGQVMKKSNGQADPRTVTKLLQELLVPVES